MKHEKKPQKLLSVDGKTIDQTTGEVLARPVIRTHYNSKFFSKNYEDNNKPSKTQPHQSLTIREILDRYAKGMPLDVERKIYFDENENSFDYDSYKRLDISEQQELISLSKQAVREAQGKLQEESRKRRDEQYQETVKKEVEKRLKELSKKQKDTNTDRTTTEAEP